MVNYHAFYVWGKWGWRVERCKLCYIWGEYSESGLVTNIYIYFFSFSSSGTAVPSSRLCFLLVLLPIFFYQRGCRIMMQGGSHTNRLSEEAFRCWWFLPTPILRSGAVLVCVSTWPGEFYYQLSINSTKLVLQWLFSPFFGFPLSILPLEGSAKLAHKCSWWNYARHALPS